MKQQYIDIGTNLNFDDFKGIYNGKQCHEPDLHRVIQRAENVGVTHIVLIATHLDDLKGNIEIINRFKDQSSITFKTTIGFHPVRINQLIQNEHLDTEEKIAQRMNELITEMIAIGKKNLEKLCAVGEIGLDYNGVSVENQQAQQQCFKQLAQLHHHFPHLPFLFHCRDAWDDFVALNEQLGYKGHKGVIHCFDGDDRQLEIVLKQGWDIGVTCLSFLTDERIETMKKIPLERLHIETDSPFCDIKQNSAAFKFVNKKSLGLRLPKYKPDTQVMRRNEPCNIIDVATIVSKINQIDHFAIIQTVYKNSHNLFFS